MEFLPDQRGMRFARGIGFTLAAWIFASVLYVLLRWRQVPLPVSYGPWVAGLLGTVWGLKGLQRSCGR